MKAILCLAVCCLFVSSGTSQETARKAQQPHNATQAETRAILPASEPDSSDVDMLRADIQRLKVLLNQMRTNLAFVQSSQTPLKHQFELETDAWQVVVEQMERRLKGIEDRRVRESAR